MARDARGGARHISEAQDVEQESPQVRRAHRRDLPISPNDDRVGVVAGVTPAPEGRFLRVHERRDLVQRVIEPRRPERGPVAALVPARVRHRPIQHGVAEEERGGDPRGPEPVAPEGRAGEEREPDRGIADRRAVAAPHQVPHALARHVGVVPLRGHQPLGSRLLPARADEAVVAAATAEGAVVGVRECRSRH